MIALALALITFVVELGSIFGGRSLLERPIVTGTLVGVVMGDPLNGMLIGATLELAFIGLFSIGAAIPPSVPVGGVLGTALALAAGAGPETALVLAFPAAALGLLVENTSYAVINPTLLHRADAYARRGSIRGVGAMHISAGLIEATLVSTLVGVAFALGSGTVSAIVEIIPPQISIALQIATGILPALGFALLGRMLINKRVVPFLFIGFLVVAYLQLPIVGVAAFGVMAAWLLILRRRAPEPVPAGGRIEEDEDDF